MSPRACALAAILLSSCFASAQTPGPAVNPVQGPFQPTWESLERYKCPEWFRDAKFGIWAHWTAQCVPEMGDWYARSMYQEGSEDYKFHLAHYGPQSQFGFKDLDNLWHAENWDPEKLMQLYVRAGAKYFVALANHHDNFDAWNSKYQPWNSVNIGPHKDIVGTWAKVAREHGLRFGVTVHAARSWDWFDVAHGADKQGPNAGIPYDGDLTKADGAGKWWTGYDPVELYSPTGSARTPEAKANYETKFFNRTMDLVSSYHPDLLYFDDGEPPTAHGLEIASSFYNLSTQWHRGVNQAVLNVKNPAQRVKESMVLDYERGRSDKISPEPWQTDTCIGEWHYRRSLFTNHQYKTPEQVIRMLCDIVSKNGNLLLNIPVRGDGTIDEDEIQFLQGMAAWMDVNHEAIFATRPWKIAGEGPVRIRGGGFSEGGESKLTAEDFRFTTKGNTLYALAMGWPADGKYVVKTLASNAQGIVGDVKDVRLLGSNQRLAWKRTGDGLEITLPQSKPCDHAWALKISGLDLAASNPVIPEPTPVVIHVATDGSYTMNADKATLSGSLQVETHGDAENIGYWDNPNDFASWTVDIAKPGTYEVTASYANVETGVVEAELAGASISIEAPSTGSWEIFHPLTLGTFTLHAAGRVTMKVRPRDAASWKAINLRWIRLTPKE